MEAIIAFVVAEGPQAAPAVKGTQWFLESVAVFAGYNVNFMAALAVAQTSGRDLNAVLDYVFIDELRQLLERYDETLTTTASELETCKSQLDVATSELAIVRTSATTLESELTTVRAACEAARESEIELQRRMSTYALRLTNNQLAVIGLILTIVTFAAGVALTLAVR
jgi:hypothetical protein